MGGSSTVVVRVAVVPVRTVPGLQLVGVIVGVRLDDAVRGLG